MIKRFLLIFVVYTGLGLMFSCSPQLFVLPVDLRDNTNVGGVNLNRKSIGVFYVVNENKEDSTFNIGVAEGFSKALNAEYFNGHNLIKISPIKTKTFSGGKENMLNLLMQSQTDVVFVLGEPKLYNMQLSTPEYAFKQSKDSAIRVNATINLSQNIFVYDAMNKEDMVYKKINNMPLSMPVFLPNHFTQQNLINRTQLALNVCGNRVGATIAKPYFSAWKTENIYLMYFVGDKWNNALRAAYEFRWQDAMEIWFKLAQSKDKVKRSAAEYNLAVACFIMGNKALAIEWLNASDADATMRTSKLLRLSIKQDINH